MRNNANNDNSLIKRNRLTEILKKWGIKRFEKKALKTIEKKIIDELKEDSKLMTRKLMLEGRKTLTEKDILFVIAAKNKEKDEFEI